MNILEACDKGDYDRVKELLENGADPTVENNGAIRYASENGHVKILDLLLQDGRADPTANDNYPIRMAVWYGYSEIVEMLLHDGRADPTIRNNYPLHISSLLGNRKTVEMLLQDGRVEVTDMVLKGARSFLKEMLLEYKYRVDGKEYQRMKSTL